MATGIDKTEAPLDVWLRFTPENTEESEKDGHPLFEDEADAEANTYLTDDGRYRVEWSLTAVGLIKSETFDTHLEAAQWLESEHFTDFTV